MASSYIPYLYQVLSDFQIFFHCQNQEKIVIRLSLKIWTHIIKVAQRRVLPSKSRFAF